MSAAGFHFGSTSRARDCLRSQYKAAIIGLCCPGSPCGEYATVQPSGSTSTILPRGRVRVDLLDLFLLRSWAAILQRPLSGKARREQRRTADLRHRRSEEGRQDQRDRQRAYRLRRAKLSVMDQGSPHPPCSGKMVRPVLFVSVAAGRSGPAKQVIAKIHAPVVPYCVLCGRVGPFVDPRRR